MSFTVQSQDKIGEVVAQVHLSAAQVRDGHLKEKIRLLECCFYLLSVTKVHQMVLAS